MDLETLRNRQAPLKQKYKESPESGVLTMKVLGRIDQPEIAINIPTHTGSVQAGLHQAAGGDGTMACSGDMLLEALVGCAGVTLAAVATSMEIKINRGTISAEGDLDFKGTLGVDRDSPVGFRQIRLIFDLHTDVDEETVEKLISLTERYCVIYQTLATANSIESILHKPTAG
jgi:uncharacterized OsmC-like protein